jgi:pantetheine-phosphate adenylyltransferase
MRWVGLRQVSRVTRQEERTAVRGAALCPGSFDPVTNGHLDVIERAACLFDSLFVAVFTNAEKTPLFPAAERVDMLRTATAHLPQVRVEAVSGLLTAYARSRGIRVVVRGLRAVSDFEYELAMAEMNKQLYGEMETLFMMTRPTHSFLSSSLVKEVARWGGDVSGLVPPHVAQRLREAYGAG